MSGFTTFPVDGNSVTDGPFWFDEYAGDARDVSVIGDTVLGYFDMIKGLSGVEMLSAGTGMLQSSLLDIVRKGMDN